MKKTTLFLTIAISVMFFSCSEKSITQKSVTQSECSEPKEKSIEQSLAEDLLAEFQDNFSSWNACVVYDGKEYTSLEDFRNRDK